MFMRDALYYMFNKKDTEYNEIKSKDGEKWQVDKRIVKAFKVCKGTNPVNSVDVYDEEDDACWQRSMKKNFTVQYDRELDGFGFHFKEVELARAILG